MQVIDPMSVDALAAAKHLDPAYLTNAVGLEACRYGGEPAVRFPYRDARGTTTYYKYRVADGCRNPTGVRLTAYGLERLAALAPDERLVVVEGESDCWALWQHGHPALGVPGALSLGRIWTADVAALVGDQPLVLWEEPGSAGEELVVAAARALPRRTTVTCGSLPGEKDPCELLASVGSVTFPSAMRERIARAVPVIERANAILASRPPLVRVQHIRRRQEHTSNVTPDAVAHARSVSTVRWLEARGCRLRGTGRNRRTRCPFPDHDDGAPSFSVNAETGAWMCFGCGRKGGDAIELVRQLTGRTFRDAVLQLVS